MASLRAAFPSGPLIDESGEVTPAWRGFFLSLYQRTGSAIGFSSDTSGIDKRLDDEISARTTADASLNAGLANEATLRSERDGALQAGLAAEAATRAGVDGTVAGIANANAAAITAERSARIAADALLVPIAGLNMRIAELNLEAVLPAYDPGNGRLWLDATTVRIGSPAASIGLEDGSGLWVLEDGSGAWDYA